MHLTPSSNSPTLDMPPHIVTVNAAAARSAACFCISKHFCYYTLLFAILFFQFLCLSTNTDPSLVHNGFFEILFLKVFNLIYILECGGRCSCLSHGAARREVSFSILCRFLGNFKEIVFLLSAFSSSGVHSACNKNEYQGISVGSSAAGTQSCRLYRPSCAECRRKGGNRTFHPPSES